MSNNCTSSVGSTNPASLYAFSLSQVYVLVAIIIISNLVDQFLKWLHKSGHTRKLKWYADLNHRIRRNVVTYIMQLLVTTIVLIAFLVSGVKLLFVDPLEPVEPYFNDIQYVIFFGLWIMTLYMWEMAYKMRMNAALIIHHLSTLVCICLAAVHFEITRQWFGIFGFILMGLTSLTEQTTFIALILYRMEKWKWSGHFFIFSAVWTLVSKTFLVILVCYFWGVAVIQIFLYVPGNEDLVMWVYVFWFMLIPLYGSQIYSAVILVDLWRVCVKKTTLEKADLLYPSTEGKKRSARLEIEREMTEWNEAHPPPNTPNHLLQELSPTASAPVVITKTMSAAPSDNSRRMLVESRSIQRFVF